MRNESLQGISAMLLSVGAFALMDAGLKQLSEHYSPMQVSCLRGAASHAMPGTTLPRPKRLTHGPSCEPPCANAARAGVIVVTAAGKTNSTNSVTYQVVPRPVNDDFAGALKIASAGETILATNEFASIQPGEPFHAGIVSAARPEQRARQDRLARVLVGKQRTANEDAAASRHVGRGRRARVAEALRERERAVGRRALGFGHRW